MGTKMKGICKGFKLISQIFVVKEHHEMEIGHPTDVKHVAHIGWDGPSGSNPSWMEEFKTTPDFASNSIDFGESIEQQTASSEINRDVPPSSELRAIPKKHKRKKKNKATSSPRSGSTPRSSRAARSKTKFVEES